LSEINDATVMGVTELQGLVRAKRFRDREGAEARRQRGVVRAVKVNGVEVVEVVPHIEGTDVEVWVRARGLSEPLRPSNISDGALRILAVISTPIRRLQPRYP